MLLVGDIGGTKTVLAIVSAEGGSRAPLAQQTYPSAKYSSLESMIAEFLAGLDAQLLGAPVTGASFGVAGPVVEGRALITNLPWVIDAGQLKATFGWAFTYLINDLEAVAYAIPILEPEDVAVLSAGKPAKGGNIAVLAPGTGLGEAYLTFDHGKYVAHASEGSHASFAPMDAQQMSLLTFLREKMGFEHVSYERVCSGGLGIPNLYAYLKDAGEAGQVPLTEPAWLAEALASSADPTPVIITAALDQERPCELCRATLDLFVKILGQEAGNQALKVMARGGIYLGGGISPRILPSLQQPAFLEALRKKGRFHDLLADMPVYVILNSRAGLLGAAAYGLDHLPVHQA